MRTNEINVFNDNYVLTVRIKYNGKYRKIEGFQMDQNMTLEKRIAAELYSYQGRMSVFVDDLRGSTVEIGADEEFETASTIKAFILAVLYLQASRGKASLDERSFFALSCGARLTWRRRSPTRPASSWMAPGCSGPWAWGQSSR